MEQLHSPSGESIKDLINRLVKEAWEQRQEGVLLSRLGSEIARKPEIAKAELKERKLSAFIEDELSGSIITLASPANPIVRVAVPKDAEIDTSDVNRYFPRADPGRKAAHASGVSNAVLLAFSRPLAPGCKRVITLSPSVRFADISLDAEVPGSSKVLDRKWIVTPEDIPDNSERSRTILGNITEWRESHELEPSAITAKPKSYALEAKSVLELMMSCLSEAEQKRINLPLDLVAKLHGSRVG